jgi:hypothetical protein
MAKKGKLASALKGGSLNGLNFIFPPFDKGPVIYEFRIALYYELKAKTVSIFLRKLLHLWLNAKIPNVSDRKTRISYN